MKNKEITLSLETGLENGSISISDRAGEIDSWVGTKKVSRSEDLLREIDTLLLSNKIGKKQIGKIYVSREIGSQIGLRIGLATALGLKKSLGCKIEEVSVLQALTCLAEIKGESLTAVSNNNRDIFIRSFENNKIDFRLKRPESYFESISFEDFCQKILSELPKILVANENFFDFLNESIDFDMPKYVSLKNAGGNLAKYLVSSIAIKNASDNKRR